MGWACSTYGGQEGEYRVLEGKPERKRPLGRPGIDGRIILRVIFRKLSGGGGMYCKYVAGGRGRGRALVNGGGNLRFP